MIVLHCHTVGRESKQALTYFSLTDFGINFDRQESTGVGDTHGKSNAGSHSNKVNVLAMNIYFYVTSGR